MEPFFIDSISGRIFAVFHRPAHHTRKNRDILFIPPFAEELNRSRHMINYQARKFAEAGYGVLLLDLYGTGDSEGTFGDATVEIWQQDIRAAVSWLGRRSDNPLTIWAMRSGALLAVDLVQQQADISDQLILWAPVGNGERFITQFMRIKLAGEVTRKTDDTPLTMKALWTQLETGQHLEIAGYSLSPKLAKGLAALSLSKMKLPENISVNWIETSLTEPAKITPASQKIISAWQTNNSKVLYSAVNDISFWNLQEVEWAYSFTDETLKILE